MNRDEVLRFRIDPETGRQQVTAYVDDVSIMTNDELTRYYERKTRRQAIEKGGQPNYVNCYHEPLSELNDVLSVNELGTIMKLVPYIKMNARGALHSKGKRMGIREISDVINRGARQTSTIVNKLVDAGVLIVEKEGRRNVYNVSDRYHSIGYTFKGEYFTKVLQVKNRVILADLDINGTGVLYKMLPYLNYEHFYLCTNPNETDEKEIYPISHREFADIVNVDRSVINNGVIELMRKGVIAKYSGYNGEMYLANPDVISRRRDMFDERSEYVRNTFRLLERQGRRESADIDTEELPY